MMEKLAQFWFRTCECLLTSSISFKSLRSVPNVHSGTWNLLPCSSTIVSISVDSAASRRLENWSCCCGETTGNFMMCFSDSWAYGTKVIADWHVNRRQTTLTFNSSWIWFSLRWISASDVDKDWSPSDFKWAVFCIQMQRFESSWLIKTVLLTSCSTTVVKYESRSSFENTSTRLDNSEFNSSSMLAMFSFSILIDFKR